jgi:hypothetical protein
MSRAAFGSEFMNKRLNFIVASGLVLAGTFATDMAVARDNVQWSIGINLPLDPYGASIGTTIGNTRPVYVQPAPVYFAPPPVYYAPAPVYYGPAPVYYRPAPIYYRPHPRAVVLPAPVYVQPQRHGGWRRQGRDHDRRHD